LKQRVLFILIALLPLFSVGQTVEPDSTEITLPVDTIVQEQSPDTLVIEQGPDTLSTQQEPDTTDSEIFFTHPSVESDETIVGKGGHEFKPHSPQKATLYSAVLPGLGQAYNRKYWKIPLVYAGLGVAVYFLQDNIRQANYFMDSYRSATDGDPSTINTSGYNPNTLQEMIIMHRKWRDYSYLGIIAVYLLNILDAQVDAHLFNFDVSKELSLGVTPSMLMTVRPTPGLTLCLKL
jgi:hypothetical protein